MKQTAELIVLACIDVDRWIPDQKAIEKKLGGYIEEAVSKALGEVIRQSFGDGVHPEVEFLGIEWDDEC